MGKDARGCGVWVSVALLVFSSLLAPRPAHAAAECDITGGTTYRGCVMPENLWAVNTSGGNRLFPSRLSATYWAIANTSTAYQQSRCNYGPLTTPSVPAPCQGSCSTPGYSASTENHHTSVTAVSWGWVPIASGPLSPGQYEGCQVNQTVFAPLCPRGFTSTLETPFVGSSNKLYTCRPNSTTSARGAERTAGIPDTPGCRDKALCAGSAFGINPVNMATRTKYDVAEDYRNQSPFPIVWSRSYSSTARRWTFS